MNFVWIVGILICSIYIVDGASLEELLRRIPLEEQFQQSQLLNVKYQVKIGNDNAKESLNKNAETIKVQINDGPIECHLWKDSIEIIQNFEINQFDWCKLLYPFQDLSKLEGTLKNLHQTTKALAETCHLEADCEAKLEDISKSLDEVHLRVISTVSKIFRDSDTCLKRKVSEINDKLSAATELWKKCEEKV